MRVKKINPTPDQLSEAEYNAMLFIQRYRAEKWQIPTIREIAAVIDLSPSAAHTLLARLVDYGYLARGKASYRRSRSFRIIRSIEEQ